MDRQERIDILNAEIEKFIAQGSRIESRTDFQAVLVRGRPVNHILHLLLSVLTLGVWLVVWVILSISGGEERSLLQVDEDGNGIRRKI